MGKGRSVILLEFNELSPSLMYQFMASGKLPNFSRFHAQAQVFLTDAEEEAPNLNPWIQWVTVHSGLPYQEHGVFNLGEGHKLQRKCVWDLLCDAGLRVWVCGSMNSRHDPSLNGYILPDPWTTAFPPQPESLRTYFRFVQEHVLEYTNDRVPLSRMAYLKFLTFMMVHGLSLSTVNAILRQLASEENGHNRWKRAVILDKLQFDLFRSVHNRLKPHFSTFFSNSTAHFQHAYWRNMEPELFKIQPTPKEQAEFESAILFGYQEMDKLVGDFLALADAETTLMFCTALSQQPCLIYEEEGGKTFYRPRRFEQLMAFGGVEAPHRVFPVMAEQFHVVFESEEDARRGAEQLRALQVAGRSVLSVQGNGTALFCGCNIFQTLAPDSVLRGADSGRSIPFLDIFYHVEGLKSGMHHPDGMLWIRTPDGKHFVHSEKVPLTAIAPTILEMFSVPRPDFMAGRSLAEQFTQEAP